jgi:hypothetical protein
MLSAHCTEHSLGQNSFPDPATKLNKIDILRTFFDQNILKGMLLAVHKIFVGKSWYQSFVWQDLDPDAI